MTKIENQDEDVYVQLFDFGRNTCVSEAVTLNDDGSYTVFISARFSTERQRQAVAHALEHINRGDFRKHDVQQIESEAHGLTADPEQPNDQTDLEKMIKKHRRAAKRRAKKIAEYQKFIDWRMETEAEYKKEHTIFY